MSVHVKHPSGCAAKVAARRRATAQKGARTRKKMIEARGLDPARYGPDGSERGKHPVGESIAELIARIRAREAADG